MVSHVGAKTKLTTSKCYMEENFNVGKEFNFAFHFSISHLFQKKWHILGSNIQMLQKKKKKKNYWPNACAIKST
jgi:hypothetical protein